jgi:hypothetical protein
MAAMSLDMDTTGNDGDTIGTREDCVETDAGQTVVADITAEGIPASNAMVGFQSTLTLQAANLQVVEVDATTLMLDNAAGSQPFYTGTGVPGPQPGLDFVITATDPIAAPASAESGTGTLARISIEVNAAAPDGIYNVDLNQGGHIDTVNATWIPDAFNNARIAVGDLTCESTFMKGDVDCTNVINAVDALKILRHSSLLSVTQNEPCPDIGTGTPVNGDNNCSGGATPVNSVDALLILRYNAALSVTYPVGCDPIGTQ